nr:unnamed protein product [Callosobruchus analis]
MGSHPARGGNRITNRCIHCNKTFVFKRTLDDHIVKRHPDFIASVSRKVHECTKCSFKTVSTNYLKRHMVSHQNIAHTRITHKCIYCNKTLSSKQALDDHILNRHPDFIASVSGKVHECTECTYKTVFISQLRGHMAKHPDVAHKCIYCNNTFTCQRVLDDHIVKRHPDFIASVSRKVHECTKCAFKTVRPSRLKEHIKVKHPDRDGNRCIYCNKTFVQKQTLDDHIVKTHPDFIASVNSKIYECIQCTYKTTISKDIREHLMSKHHQIANNCSYCNKTFINKSSLDDHIIKAHPDFIASVSSKIHECTECTYKTVFTSQLKSHMAKHPDIAGRCIYCSKTFVRREPLDDHIIKTHPDFVTSVSSRVHECTKCTFKTTSTSQLRRHAVTHDTAGNRITIRCIYCNKTFTTKQKLDEHIIKTHPDFIASVSSKVHECTECTYKTTNNCHMKQHMVKHADVGNRCIHCNKTFKTKQKLDDHIIKKHPDFIAFVTSKVHECTECTYKTTDNSHLKQHMAKHPDVAGNHIPNRCIHCNKAFTTKKRLDDHIIKKHPDFISSVSSKVHECTECTYKTTDNSNLEQHMAKHPDIAGNHIPNRCIHCNKAFTTKKRLDDHIIKKHPDFISSVSSKVHECTECTYKTTDNSNLKQHMLKHPDIAGNHITNRCIHCNKTFTTKKRLDDHIMKKHPDFIASVTSKVHQCTECTYKTTNNSHLRRHMVKHPDIADRCIHCNKAFTTKKRLDDHIIKKHPDFIASVTSKVHQCTECTYKTTDNCHLKQHMAKHPNISGNHIITVCIHCNKTFTTKQKLDEHIVKTHPDFIASVSSGGGY